MILIIMSKIVNDNVSELHAVVHEVSDSADAELRMKQSHVSK